MAKIHGQNSHYDCKYEIHSTILQNGLVQARQARNNNGRRIASVLIIGQHIVQN